jgi:predicted MFS family arabinose efflux permease
MNLLFVLCLAGFAGSFPMRALDPMLPPLARDLGVTIQEAALLSSAYSFPYAGMQLVLGPLGDALGRTRVIVTSLAIVALGMAASALAPDYTTLFIARLVVGGFSGGIIPVAMALLGDRTALVERQVSISRLLIAVIGGQLAGTVVAGTLVDLLGWRAVFLLCAGIAAISAIAVFIALRGDAAPRGRLTLAGAAAGYRAVFTNPIARIVLVTVSIEGMLVAGLFPFIAPMMVERGIGGSLEAGLVLGAFALGGMIYGMTARTAINLLGQRGMMKLGGLLVGAAYVASAAPLPWTGMAALYLVAGYSFFLLHNTLQTLGTELAPTARGSGIAMFAAFLLFGTTLGPVLGGAVHAVASFNALYIGAGIVMAVLGFVATRALTPK